MFQFLWSILGGRVGMRSSLLGGRKLRGIALSRLSKSIHVHPIGAFLDEVEFVGFYVVECLLQTAGPLDLDCFGDSGSSQAEAGSQIALRKIAPAAFNFPNLRNAASENPYPSPHRITIALCAHELEIQKVIPVAAAVVQ